MEFNVLERTILERIVSLKKVLKSERHDWEIPEEENPPNISWRLKNDLPNLLKEKLDDTR